MIATLNLKSKQRHFKVGALNAGSVMDRKTLITLVEAPGQETTEITQHQ